MKRAPEKQKYKFYILSDQILGFQKWLEKTNSGCGILDWITKLNLSATKVKTKANLKWDLQIQLSSSQFMKLPHPKLLGYTFGLEREREGEISVSLSLCGS